MYGRRIKNVPTTWNKADGVYIPMKNKSSALGQFRPISLRNVEGKIVFGVLIENI